jgi:hypothetical protein
MVMYVIDDAEESGGIVGSAVADSSRGIVGG